MSFLEDLFVENELKIGIYQQPWDEKSDSGVSQPASDKSDYVELTADRDPLKAEEIPAQLDIAQYWLEAGEWRNAVRSIIRHLREKEAAK